MADRLAVYESEKEEEEGKFQKQDVSDDVFLGVLEECVSTFEENGIDYVFIGGIPSSLFGRPRGTPDIDILVRQEDAERASKLLAEAGFDTQSTHSEWLYKGTKNGVVVDIIFRSEGDVYLDDEMSSRGTDGHYKGKHLRLVPPEDLVVMKAIAHEEATPQYWYDALAIIGRADLDWDYLIRRARQHGGRRILSLLVYAESNDLVVPVQAIRTLFDSLYQR